MSAKGIYDIHKSWKENLENGPRFSGYLPERLPYNPQEGYDFLGYKVRSRIGVFAGPLLNSEWVKLASDLGYDLLTYKTIRSSEHLGHPLPNILYIDQPEPFEPGRFPGYVRAVSALLPADMITITNSFGMPSKDALYLKHDIPAAEKRLKEGQKLIVSITGSEGDLPLKEDFVKAAELALDSGAGIIEANFSCPNVKSKEGSLYLSPEGAYATAFALKEALEDVPLIIKVGLFPDFNLMTKTFLALSCAGVNAIAGINTINLKVVDNEGKPALGSDRMTSGICGNAIRKAALKFTKEARKIIDTEKLSFTLIGGGGIMLPDHFDEFFDAGADFAFTATGMMFDPYLANRYHQSQKERLYAHT